VRKIVQFGAVVFFALLLCSIARADTRFEISFPKETHSDPITGRVILVIARSGAAEPRFQIGPNATPIFGLDAENLQAGQAAIVDR
jgi:hypothetical protein